MVVVVEEVREQRPVFVRRQVHVMLGPVCRVAFATSVNGLLPAKLTIWEHPTPAAVALDQIAKAVRVMVLIEYREATGQR